jgi:hypothetical protein
MLVDEPNVVASARDETAALTAKTAIATVHTLKGLRMRNLP